MVTTLTPHAGTAAREFADLMASRRVAIPADAMEEIADVFADLDEERKRREVAEDEWAGCADDLERSQRDAADLLDIVTQSRRLVGLILAELDPGDMADSLQHVLDCLEWS